MSTKPFYQGLTLDRLRQGRPDLVQQITTAKIQEIEPALQRHVEPGAVVLSEVMGGADLVRVLDGKPTEAASDAGISLLTEILDTRSLRERQADMPKVDPEPIDMSNVPNVTDGKSLVAAIV